MVSGKFNQEVKHTKIIISTAFDLHTMNRYSPQPSSSRSPSSPEFSKESLLLGQGN